jgi:streptogramin lyase
MTALYVLGLFLAASPGNPCPGVGAAPESLGIWAGLKPGHDRFQHPFGLASDGTGHVFVLNGATGRVTRFDAAGSAEASWELPIPAAPEVGIPANAIAASGTAVFVQSPRAGGILVFDSRGTHRGTFPYSCGHNGLAADSMGQLYVAGDRSASAEGGMDGGPRVWKLNRQGEELSHWSIPEHGPLAADPDGSLWGVTRSYEGGPEVLRHWTPFGEILSDWDLSPFGRRGIADIAVNARGHVFAAVRPCAAVVEFDRMGRVVRRWSSAGSSAPPLSELSSLVIGPAGHLYVADWAQHRIVKYDPERRR